MDAKCLRRNVVNHPEELEIDPYFPKTPYLVRGKYDLLSFLQDLAEMLCSMIS